jgi:hypothetical protein
MSMDGPVETITEAVASIEEVSSRIEDIFARTGSHLGRGHSIFKDLNGGLTALSRELSGAEIEGASAALRDIAGRLNGLAEALPAESALLGGLGSSAKEASSLLQPLSKHVQLITIIARSARIEAASLDENRANFLAFTQEAFDLGKAVERSIDGCARDQQLLSMAVETALARQKDFEKLYRAPLLSASSELIAAHSGMREQQSKAVQLADLAGSSTNRISEAVGRAIVSLQSGDSTRQRLEHVCRGLRMAAGNEPGIAPSANADALGQEARVVCRLQAAQLKDAEREFGGDISEIVRSLTAIHADAAGIVGQGRSLFGGGSGADTSSFLVTMKQTLAQASALIATCERAGQSVDDALSVVDTALAKFRHTISELSEAVVDIILIGMNASLKAGHLGTKGNAFVVIANELKATADQVSAGAERLKPILDSIEKFARDLRALRVHGNPAQLAELEPSILQALREIEIGNGRLGALMQRLIDEGAEFEASMQGAQDLMATLGTASATLPSIASRLETTGAITGSTNLAASGKTVLDDLFAHYTMERERTVHVDFLRRSGLTSMAPSLQVREEAEDDGVLLF